VTTTNNVYLVITEHMLSRVFLLLSLVMTAVTANCDVIWNLGHD